jgi:two-component system chemotaxis response regulator CheB
MADAMRNPLLVSACTPPVRVVVVDDSRLMRELLQSALTESGDIDVVGAAANPHEARKIIRATDPDVVTLDVEMPSMDGLEFLRRIMDLRPMPVVMVAGSTTSGAETTLTALEIGAVDFVAKPSGRAGWNDFAATVRYKVREASRVTFGGGLRRWRRAVAEAGGDAAVREIDRHRETSPRRLAGHDAAHLSKRLTPTRSGCWPRNPDQQCDLIAIGASTGGVTAINRLLSAMMPRGGHAFPPIAVAQHMPHVFTARFAERLARTNGLDVAEAADGEVLGQGMIRVAPGEQHLRVVRSGDHVIAQLGDDPPVNGHRPSVDVLFSSAAVHLGARAIGVVLTGMGSDGAKGLMEMRKAGAQTFGEAEESCTIYGMPKAAKLMGAVGDELEIDCLAARLRDLIAGKACAHETTQ